MGLQKNLQVAIAPQHTCAADSVAPTFAQPARVLVGAKLHTQLDDHPGTNGDQTDGSNLGHDLWKQQHRGTQAG